MGQYIAALVLLAALAAGPAAAELSRLPVKGLKGGTADAPTVAVIPPGEYACGNVRIDPDHVTIKGDGVICRPGPGGPNFSIRGDYVTIKGITFAGMSVGAIYDRRYPQQGRGCHLT
ncbi:MAG: hypothetical protein FJX56_14500, partial [Alphaproteobacteria bacterium]|nr:hypothetical protein [Alphaproteobacteria bacterium]